MAWSRNEIKQFQNNPAAQLKEKKTFLCTQEGRLGKHSSHLMNTRQLDGAWGLREQVGG